MSFPIVFATDENYIVPTYVAVNSLLNNINPNTDVRIFILCSGVKEVSKIKFYDLSEKISFINVELPDLMLNEDLSYISIATYYRFLIPKLLKEYDRCLYLDSDIVVTGDITPLLNEKIEDYALMGVRNYFSKEPDTYFYEERCAECDLDTLDYYVNAGVLLMNLEELRKDNLYEEMINDAVHKIYSYNDQDILNKYCKGKIGLISVKYNFMVHYLKNMETISKVLDENVCHAAHNPVIVHYCTKFKPWKYKGYLMADLWYKAACHSPSNRFKSDALKPFIKESRRQLSSKERILDKLKFLYRKYFTKSFVCTKKHKGCMEGESHVCILR